MLPGCGLGSCRVTDACKNLRRKREFRKNRHGFCTRTSWRLVSIYREDVSSLYPVKVKETCFNTSRTIKACRHGNARAE